MSWDSGQARQYTFGLEIIVDSRVWFPRRMPRTLKVSPMEPLCNHGTMSQSDMQDSPE